MLEPNEIEAFSMIFDEQMKELEAQVMLDIIRRISINGEITRSADWQLNRLFELGESKRFLKKAIKTAFNLDSKGINHLYKDILRKGYERSSALYKYKGKAFISFDKNEALQQYIAAIAEQTAGIMKNISQSLGFAVKTGAQTVFKPIAEYYQRTLDNAINGIATGVFDYNTVLKRTVSELTNSGLRTVDYASGRSNRVDVAARRAVMTGLSQTTAKINEINAEKLGTDMFEVTWHSGARPAHQVWQGGWYTSEQLKSVCGLGSVTGLCGANCYHDYYPVIPGYSVPTYTAEELAEMNRQENIPLDYNGKAYTKYEALQRQRRLETQMRAERQKIKLLTEGGADENDIILARAKYRSISHEYTDFSKAMDLPEQRQRVTAFGLGNIGRGKYKTVAKSGGSGIIDLSRKIERKEKNVGAFANLQIPMQKRAVLDLCRKYDVDTKGLTFKIQRSEQLLNLGFFGITDYDNIGRIDLFPNAFSDEEQLIRTVIHEKCHVKQLKKYGKKYVQDNLDYMEKVAYRFEDIFYKILKRRGNR